MIKTPHTVALLAFDGCQLLDVTGPASVFAAANKALGRQIYDIEIVSPEGGAIATSSGVVLQSKPLSKLKPANVGTFLVAGGDYPALSKASDAAAVKRWVPRYAEASGRFGSICSGAFVLAELGLIDGKRVATHWTTCDRLAKTFPKVEVDANSLFVEDGGVWSSAGIAAGIDMSLAIVEKDIGRAAAYDIAKFLVLYVRRPGYQSQFSSLLRVQASVGAPFSELAFWIQTRLNEKLDVPTLAAQVGLAERTFYRKFVASMGQTPAQFVEDVRLDAVCSLLSEGLPLKTVAQRTGLKSTARLGAAFERRFGMTPSLFRQMHCAPNN